MSDIAENIEQVSLVPKRKLAEKFGVCMKTIDRWVEAEILEKPIVINGRHYFSRDARVEAA